MKTILLILGILAIACLISGCATTQPCDPVEVMIPVHVPCVATMPQKPAFAMEDIAADASDFDKIQALGIDYLQQKQYINSLEAVVEGCITF